MKITMLYLSGNYATIDTTVQTIQDGILLDDAYLDVSDLDGAGVVLTRASYNIDAEGRQRLRGPITVIAPEELENIGYVSVDGQALLKRTNQGFERCVTTTLNEIFSAGGDDEAGTEIDDMDVD